MTIARNEYARKDGKEILGVNVLTEELYIHRAEFGDLELIYL